MLWKRQWKKDLVTLLTTCANDPNRQHLTLEQKAREGNFLKPNDQIHIPESALLDIVNAAKTSFLSVPYDSAPTQ